MLNKLTSRVILFIYIHKGRSCTYLDVKKILNFKKFHSSIPLFQYSIPLFIHSHLQLSPCIIAFYSTPTQNYTCNYNIQRTHEYQTLFTTTM